MEHKAEVIEIIDPAEKITSGYKIKVRGKAENGGTFTYVFIKNKKEDVDAIKVGYKWTMGCKPVTFKS